MVVVEAIDVVVLPVEVAVAVEEVTYTHTFPFRRFHDFLKHSFCLVSSL